MKLILLRHAKSSWDDPRTEDFDRVLNARGRTSAKAIGAWLRTHGHIPDHVLCSSAARTRETFDLLGFTEARVEYSDGLYLAGDATIARAIETTPKVGSLMVIGHNPGLGDLAVQLAGLGLKDDALHAFPTCACLVLENGAPVDFTVPRRLMS